MKLSVVFYTRPGYLDSAFSLLSELAKRVEIHLIVECAPEGQGIGAFPLPGNVLPAGLAPSEALPDWLPPAVQARLQGLASFSLAVFTPRRAFHPSNLATCWRVARFIRSICPELLHFDEASSRAVALPYLLRDLPLVLSTHDNQPHLGEAGGRFGLVRRFFLRRTRAVIFHSHYCQETFPGLTEMTSRGVQTAVIPLGVYDVFNDVAPGPIATIEPEPPTALFFGRISPYKGIEVLLAAAPLVAQRVPGFRLIIAGAPIPGYQVPESSNLQNGGSIECRLERIRSEEVPTLFGRSSIVVLPYLEATQSGVISTAYAFLKPVVATTAGGLPEMVHDGITGRLVPPRDHTALAAAMVELLLDNRKLQQMSEAIWKKRRSEWSWQRLSSETVDVYRRAIANR
ncbi:MAG: glycosyltransferase family 4 protein [candidate division KSB1 bacterium]|nr:glycosyltransferase family 4 protein [candidate division KSB1 bacterium]